MWASKIGSCAAAGAAAPRTNRSVGRRGRRIAGILTHRLRRSRRPRRTAHAAGTVSDARSVGDRREDDSVRLAHSLLVGAAATADDPRARAADQRGCRALEPQELGLHRAAEGVVTPGSVAANDAVAGDDHRHRIGPERVADRAGGAWMADASREGRVGVDLAERNATGL